MGSFWTLVMFSKVSWENSRVNPFFIATSIPIPKGMGSPWKDLLVSSFPTIFTSTMYLYFGFVMSLKNMMVFSLNIWEHRTRTSLLPSINRRTGRNTLKNTFCVKTIFWFTPSVRQGPGLDKSKQLSMWSIAFARETFLSHLISGHFWFSAYLQSSSCTCKSILWSSTVQPLSRLTHENCSKSDILGARGA